MSKTIKPGTYKSLNGELYKVLCEANHFITNDRFVVFQKAGNENVTWVLSKEQFLKEAYEDQKTSEQSVILQKDSTTIYFPELNYTQEIPPLVDKGGLSKSVKSMVSLLDKKGFISKTYFSELKTDDDIEALILKKIVEYSCGDNVEEIFHLIQIWGGITGRGIYVFEDSFDWSKIAPHYQRLVEVCLSISTLCDESIEKLISAIAEFDASVKHMGVSYITKHTRYWLYHSVGVNTLPIYDSIMAKVVMRKNSA